MPTPLHLITSLARAGALERAWALFREAGYHALAGDPAALAVKGRLLKDQAALAKGERRHALLVEAEAAYQQADRLAPAPWLLINVATLAALQEDRQRAAIIAGEVLSRLDAGGVVETPYYLAATRAEAQLLRGDATAAARALDAAVAAQPAGWQDRASTLRQLAMILDLQGRDRSWLDRWRPPLSLHYAGHLGVAEPGSAALRAAIDAVLDEAPAGFAYGALAAGADIVIAEAVLARGAELHVHLPVQVPAFLAQSVAPYGDHWTDRFERCLEAATSLEISSTLNEAYQPLATALAGDMAMGAAVLNARLLEGKALQLLVVDDGGGPFGTGSSTARDGGLWRAASRPQRIIVWPRDAPVAASSSKREGRPDLALLAVLDLQVDGVEQLDEGGFAALLDAGLDRIGNWIQQLDPPPAIVMRHGNGWRLGFADPGEAVLFTRSLAAQPVLPRGRLWRISGAYGLIHCVREEMIGPLMTVLGHVAATAVPGVLTVTQRFAVALALTGPDLPDGRLIELGNFDHGLLYTLQFSR